MTADDRSLSPAVPDTFDFDTQAGILFVLRAIRAATLSSEDKNTLKDLVFLYNTGGKDELIKQKLAETLNAHGVTPSVVLLEVPKKTTTPERVTPASITPGFMGGRLTPVFHPPAVPTSVITKPEAKPVASSAVVPAVHLVPNPVIISPPDSIPKVVPPPADKITPVMPLVRPVATATQPVAETSTLPREPINIEVAPKSSSQVLGEVSPEYAATRMERIRVIKSDINSRVGNPVNLVDVDNSLGREYMSALLEAMKLLSSASEQESSLAMNRLETVYTRVLNLLDSQQKTAATTVVSTAPVVPTPDESVVIPVVSVPQPVMSQTVPEVVAPVAVTIEPAPVRPLASPVATEPTPDAVFAPASDVIVRSKVSDKPSKAPIVSNWSVPQSTVDVVPSVGATVTPSDAVTVNRMSTPPAEPLRPVITPVGIAYQPEVAASVMEVKPLRAITELPTADEVSAVEAMSSNPLYTKDVDAGLDQLLSEWAIFKKSGLFGTGPKGREHPLYLKIAPMQVPLILSGRFEGSTQEIKQSITDYMNGWRYEQGIIYEANETFEQYLRRVIRHIIDLQKTKRRP